MKKYSILIIAAGLSSRLYPITKDIPKSILDINGTTLLKETLDNLNSINKISINIDNVYIVVGFKSEKIIDYVNKLNYENVKVTFIHNPMYSTLNNNFSVWLANNYLENKEFILINGDVIYDKEILNETIKCEYDNFSVVDTTKPLSQDSMKVLIYKNKSLIRAFSKTFYNGDGSTVGLHKFSKSGSRLFFETLYNQLENGINSFHHSAIDKMVKDEKYNHYALDINGLKWLELDDEEDLQLVKEYV